LYIRNDEDASCDDLLTSIISLISEPRATTRNGYRNLCAICTYAAKR